MPFCFGSLSENSYQETLFFDNDNYRLYVLIKDLKQYSHAYQYRVWYSESKSAGTQLYNKQDLLIIHCVAWRHAAWVTYSNRQNKTSY